MFIIKHMSRYYKVNNIPEWFKESTELLRNFYLAPDFRLYLQATHSFIHSFSSNSLIHSTTNISWVFAMC